jgi:two-component system chemotaxis sensor kinase CheA
VRDLSAELGKKIVLEVQGEETELDRQVLELVKDPLTHMLRNACDHGIELPAQRAARGKPEQGRIVVQARHEGGVVIVTVSDDGEGLDAGKIGAKAVEKGLVSAEQLARLSAREIRMFIMHPGFSTAKTVSHVSGRGVGMDVVRSNIEKIGGAIGMDSIPGQGTSFTLHIPLTLALIPALIFTICGQRYGMPQMNVQEVLALDTPSAPPVEWIQDTPVLRLRGQIIPLISAAMLFSLRRDAGRADVRPDSLVAVVTVGSHRYGLVLDAIHGSEEVVIKSIAPVLRNTLVFAGNTVLGDGRVVMILDPAAIARVFHIEADMHAAAPEPAPAGEHASMLVFRAGEGVAKALPLALVSRVQCIAPEAISRSGAQVLATLDGRMVPLVTVDGMAMPQHGEIMALMLADDRSESAMGLVIEAIIDTSESDLALSTVTARAGILGSMLLEDGRAVDVVDIAHFLVQQSQDWFSQHQHQHGDFAPEDVRGDVAAAPPIATHDASAGPARPVQKILLVDDSPFFRNMLHPILRTAGYDVSVCADPAQAIALHDQGAMFDVILSDIEMPGMDGYGFVARMRADSAWRNTPFIAITSHNTPADIAYGFKMGFDRYIGKFNREELLHAISHTQH